MSAAPRCHRRGASLDYRSIDMALFLLGLSLGLAGAVAGAALPRSVRVIVASSVTSTGCMAALASSLEVLRSGNPIAFHATAVFPLSGVQLMIDPLSALFIATTSCVGIAALVFNIGYARHAPRRVATSTLSLFLTSLLLIPATADVTMFMIAWEWMAVTSTLALLVGHRVREETRSAAQWYAAMTHIGAAAILFGFLLIGSHGPGLQFTSIQASASHLSAATRSVAFLLLFAGFASKAGAVPLHVWLPRAHPEAPSPASALMSGAMVNLGIYGIIRVGGSILHNGPLWWWLIVSGIGIVSALYGALHAAASADLKRLLGYSTIDNMGLALIGIGIAGALQKSGYEPLAALAMFATLFHIVNHACFKGCLFLGAGAIEHATGVRDLDLLGGLARKLPWIAVLFGLAGLAMSAVPGLNGFSSEWLLLESLLGGFSVHQPATLVALIAGVATLALAGGLTAVAIVKAIGIGLLGRPRSANAERATRVHPSMPIGMTLLAIPCLVFGIVPGVLARSLDEGVSSAMQAPLTNAVRPGLGLSLASLPGSIEPLLIVAAVAAAMGVTMIALRLMSPVGARRAEAWGCGREYQSARMEYTATSFAEPLSRVFENVLQPNHDVAVTHVAESRFFLRTIRFTTRAGDAIEHGMYRPITNLARRWGARARRIQNGSIHRYLGFGFATLVVALVVLTW